jgi:hypothetical protein
LAKTSKISLGEAPNRQNCQKSDFFDLFPPYKGPFPPLEGGFLIKNPLSNASRGLNLIKFDQFTPLPQAPEKPLNRALGGPPKPLFLLGASQM